MGPVSCLIIQDDPPISGGQETKYTGGSQPLNIESCDVPYSYSGPGHSSPVHGSQSGLGVISAGQACRAAISKNFDQAIKSQPQYWRWLVYFWVVLILPWFLL